MVTASENRISIPPIVGVPFFFWWPAGPSSRIDCPICSAVKRRMTIGPRTRESVRATSDATSVRKVMYLNTPSAAQRSRNA